MKKQIVLLFNNRKYFKKRANSFIEKQLRKKNLWMTVEIICVDNFIEFSRALEDHPDLVILAYDKTLKKKSRFFEERILCHVRNEVPEAKTVVISDSYNKLRRLFSDTVTEVMATGDNVLQQTLLVLQNHIKDVKKDSLEVVEHRYYQIRYHR